MIKNVPNKDVNLFHLNFDLYIIEERYENVLYKKSGNTFYNIPAILGTLFISEEIT
jgi:hypothetical protein